jgi:sulfur-carrier protein adenylyltransferase/sulfurtransferase
MSRWSRQTILPELGEDGQKRLKNATILCVGSGALGSPAILYLAAAGVGKMILVDPDVVEISNLQRQIIHSESFEGKAKVESAKERLMNLNSSLQLETHAVYLTPDNALELSKNCDLIIDGSDNFPTRFLTNDLAFFQKIPLVHAAIQKFEGQMTVFAPHLSGPCYRCLLPALPKQGTVPSCAEAGVIGALPGIMGSMQAMEAIKIITKIGELPLGKLLCYDAISSSFRTLKLARDPSCRLCGKNPSIHSLYSEETTQQTPCTMNQVPEISVTELHQFIITKEPIYLIDVREQSEYDAAAIDGSHLIPLNTLPTSIDQIPTDQKIIIHCKSGMRSAVATQFLLENGFFDVVNVTGGIIAWMESEFPTNTAK